MNGIELEQVARMLWRPHFYLRDGERLLSREYHTGVMERKCRRSGMHLATVGSLAQTDLKQASCAGKKAEGEWNTLIDAHVCARFERRKNSVCDTSRWCNETLAIRMVGDAIYCDWFEISASWDTCAQLNWVFELLSRKVTCCKMLRNFRDTRREWSCI